ncbi:hypothetical protein ACVFI8_07855 [Agarivorans sp. MS3-6]
MTKYFAIPLWIGLIWPTWLWADELLQPVSLPVAVLAVPTDVLHDYHQFLLDRNPLLIDDFSGQSSRRDVVELVLIQQALFLGGWEEGLSLQVSDSYLRTNKLLEHGSIAATATTVWSKDVASNQHLLMSAQMVRAGDFFAGLYVRADHPILQLQRIPNHDEVKQLSLISSKQWTVDWQTLQLLDFAKLHSISSWSGMYGSVIKGRVDALLAPFQAGQDMALLVEGERLLPIPHYKVALNDSRVYAVSAAFPHAKEMLRALDKGIEHLRGAGQIEKAYQQAGFINMQVSDWRVVRP